MPQTLDQAAGLYQKNFLTAGSPLGILWRHKRRANDRAPQLIDSYRAEPEGLDPEVMYRMSGGKTAVALPLTDQALQINIGARQLIIELKSLGLGQYLAVFSDQRVAGEDQVGARFVRSGRGIGIGRQAAGRLGGDQCPPVSLLAEDLRAGGKVEQQGGTNQRLRAAWRRNRPGILADLDADLAIGEFFGTEQQIIAEGDLLTV